MHPPEAATDWPTQAASAYAYRGTGKTLTSARLVRRQTQGCKLIGADILAEGQGVEEQAVKRVATLPHIRRTTSLGIVCKHAQPHTHRGVVSWIRIIIGAHLHSQTGWEGVH